MRRLVPQERFQQHTAEFMSGVPALQAAEEPFVDAVKGVPQERFQQCTVEQVVDAPVPQIVEDRASYC